MCGTGRSEAGEKRTARPGMMPRQRASPSSDASNNSCIPRQIPSTGCRRVGIRAARRLCRSRDMASAAAPTPGRTTWLAARISPGSADTDEGAPSRCSAYCSEAMFAPPLASMATIGPCLIARPCSKCPLRARQIAAFEPDGLAKAAAHALEARLDHVMRVFAAHGDVQRRPQGFRERAEKMRDQLGRQFADPFTVETPLPHEVGPARDVERDLRLGFVHGQQESIACDAALVAEGFTQRGSQSQGAVLDGVMLVDVQIAAASQIEREAAMLRDLFQHVIEKSQAGDDCARALAR